MLGEPPRPALEGPQAFSRSCGKEARSRSSPLASSSAATANDALWGSTPISTFMSARTSVSVGPPPPPSARVGHSYYFVPCTHLFRATLHVVVPNKDAEIRMAPVLTPQVGFRGILRFSKVLPPVRKAYQAGVISGATSVAVRLPRGGRDHFGVTFLPFSENPSTREPFPKPFSEFSEK
jgi:hypothetical protein